MKIYLAIVLGLAIFQSLRRFLTGKHIDISQYTENDLRVVGFVDAVLWIVAMIFMFNL